MPILHAIVLGVVQGLSEFLPVSSSGHLVLVRWLLGWDELSGEAATAFDVAVHLGTLVGAGVYLRRDVLTYASAALTPLLGRGPLGTDGRVGWSLVLSAVPAGFVGVLAGGALLGTDRIVVIALALIVFGVLLGAADRMAASREAQGRGAQSRKAQSREAEGRDAPRLEQSDFGWRHALAMGAGQALALQPGVSRSGVTMTVARSLGYSREAAVRLAFLMSLPLIAGAGVYGLLGLSVPSSLWPALGWGAVTSMVTGWAAVWGAAKIASRVGLRPFVVYRIVAGCAVLGLVASGF